MSSLAILSRYKFVSSGEEKVIRVFQAPENFVQNFRRICGIENDMDGMILKQLNVPYLNWFNFIIDIIDLPKGAAVPSLGLSNKAIYEDDNTAQANRRSNKEPYPEESHFTAVELYGNSISFFGSGNIYLIPTKNPTMLDVFFILEPQLALLRDDTSYLLVVGFLSSYCVLLFLFSTNSTIKVGPYQCSLPASSRLFCSI